MGEHIVDQGYQTRKREMGNGFALFPSVLIVLFLSITTWW